MYIYIYICIGRGTYASLKALSETLYIQIYRGGYIRIVKGL